MLGFQNFWNQKVFSNSFSVPNVPNGEARWLLGGCSTILAAIQSKFRVPANVEMCVCALHKRKRPNWSQRPCAQLAQSFAVESVSKKNKNPSARVFACLHSLSSVFVGLREENNGSVWLKARLPHSFGGHSAAWRNGVPSNDRPSCTLGVHSTYERI